jgi:hypothetical protein
MRNHRAVAIVPVVSLCPSCTHREIDTPSGLCAPCAVERVAENYAERDHVTVRLRSISWSERTTRPDGEVVKLRQQRSRLRRIVQPREPAPADVDPWLLAEQAVRALARVRSALPRTSNRVDDLELAIELVRRLAWGPNP